MKTPVLLAIAVVAAIVQKAERWWSGYSVDATGGLGLFAPALLLPIMVIPALVVAIAIGRLIQGRPGSRTLFSLSLIAFLLQTLTPSPKMAGFKTRMSHFSQSEYLALAASIRSAGGRGDLFVDPSTFGALEQSHPILRVSPDVRPKAYADGQRVQVRWGSGLTGAFAADIWSGDAEPPVSGDAIDPTPLYPNVRLVWIF